MDLMIHHKPITYAKNRKPCYFLYNAVFLVCFQGDCKFFNRNQGVKKVKINSNCTNHPKYSIELTENHLDELNLCPLSLAIQSSPNHAFEGEF